MNFHEEGILPETLESFYKLSELAEISDYTLIGGTALSIQINHRLSEDLDFCTWSEKPLDTKGLEGLMRNNFEVKNIDILSENHLDFFVGEKMTKISFFRDNLNQPIVKGHDLKGSIKVASIEAIGAMKLNVLNHRSKYRDLYDIYCISKLKKIKTLLEGAHRFNPSISTKGYLLNLMNPSKISNENITYLNPKFKLTASEIRLELADKWRKEKSKGFSM